MTYIVHTYTRCVYSGYAAQYTAVHTIDYSKSIGSVRTAHRQTHSLARKQTHDRN